MAITILTPILYVGVLLASLVVFSSVYRRQKLTALANTRAWYPDNFAKELYFSLKDAADEDEKAVPEKTLKAALIRWASEDLRQFIRMRENKPVMTALHQRGSIGDDIWNRFQTSEKILEIELQEIAKEAEELQAGWSQQIFQTATEVTQNEAIRKRMADFPSQQTEYREAYERTKKASIAEFSGEK